MIAPAPTLDQRILAALAGHSAQTPVRADDVIAVVGGPEPDTWAALEQLVKTCQINTAHIQRKTDSEPWLALWPTGVIREIGGWRGEDHQALFTPHRTQREIVKAATAPKVRQPRRARAADPEARPVCETVQVAESGKLAAPVTPPPKPDPVQPRSVREELRTAEPRRTHQATPRKPRSNADVTCSLARDGSLTVRFGPAYATDVCAVFVQDLRRELREGKP